jgi:hypothetical protein
VTDGVLSDIVTISVLILINTDDKADPPTSKAGSTGPNAHKLNGHPTTSLTQLFLTLTTVLVST